MSSIPVVIQEGGPVSPSLLNVKIKVKYTSDSRDDLCTLSFLRVSNLGFHHRDGAFPRKPETSTRASRKGCLLSDTSLLLYSRGARVRAKARVLRFRIAYYFEASGDAHLPPPPRGTCAIFHRQPVGSPRDLLLRSRLATKKSSVVCLPGEACVEYAGGACLCWGRESVEGETGKKRGIAEQKSAPTYLPTWGKAKAQDARFPRWRTAACPRIRLSPPVPQRTSPRRGGKNK